MSELTPISLQEAQDCLEQFHDPTLASMIRRGLPLTRHMYITMSYDADAMRHWDYEKEASLPDCFKDEKSAEEMIARRADDEG